MSKGVIVADNNVSVKQAMVGQHGKDWMNTYPSVTKIQQVRAPSITCLLYGNSLSLGVFP